MTDRDDVRLVRRSLRINDERAITVHSYESIQTNNMNILQLARRPLYPPSSGEEVRVWKTAEKLMDLGDLWIGAPAIGEREAPGEFSFIELDSTLLKTHRVKNDLWLGLFLLSKRHPLQWALNNAIVSRVDNHDEEFDVVVAEFPQMTGAAFSVAQRHNAKVLLNKHNALFELLDRYLRNTSLPSVLTRRAVRNMYDFERRSIERADFTVFQSAENAARFEDIPESETAVIPNGCDFEAIRAGGDYEQLVQAHDIDTTREICVFVGSMGYAPNRAAARVISEEFAPTFPDIEFLLVGRDPPDVGVENVHVTGFVDDLPGVLELADIGICPLFVGSGVKLKMLDYFAAGLPVVTTPIGVEGLPVEDGQDAIVYESVEGLKTGLERLASSPGLRTELAQNAIRIGEAHSWTTLLKRYEDVFTRLRGENVEAARQSGPERS